MCKIQQLTCWQFTIWDINYKMWSLLRDIHRSKTKRHYFLSFSIINLFIGVYKSSHWNWRSFRIGTYCMFINDNENKVVISLLILLLRLCKSIWKHPLSAPCKIRRKKKRRRRRIKEVIYFPHLPLLPEEDIEIGSLEVTLLMHSLWRPWLTTSLVTESH